MSDAVLKQPPASVREKLAQLLFVRIGSNLPPVCTVEEDARRVEKLLDLCPIGGLLLFNGRRDTTKQTLSRLQSRSQFPLLVAADIERGIGQQLIGHTMFPHATAFDALGDEAENAVRSFATLTARAALANGVHVAFAPVADVNTDPRNPIIATRAFGASPQRVAQLVKAFINGCQSVGLLTTAKHFPGHGNTHEDSHSSLPRVDVGRQLLDERELVPFRAAIDANVALLMTAHVQYSQLDRTGKPATLSSPILTDLLRHELGFRGAVISDSLLMEGVKQQSADEGTLAVDALNAGVDILLDVAQPQETLDALENSVSQGRLALGRVEEAVSRLWYLKQTAFAGRKATEQQGGTDQDNTAELLEKESASFALDCARRSIHLLRNDQEVLPLSTDGSLLAVLLKPFETRLDESEQPLAEELRSRFADVTYVELGPDSQEGYDRILKLAASAEQLLVAMIVKPAAWHRFGLEERVANWLHKLLKHDRCILASLGSPEALRAYSEIGAQLCTFSDVAVSQRALAERLTISEE